MFLGDGNLLAPWRPGGMGAHEPTHIAADGTALAGDHFDFFHIRIDCTTP